MKRAALCGLLALATVIPGAVGQQASSPTTQPSTEQGAPAPVPPAPESAPATPAAQPASAPAAAPGAPAADQKASPDPKVPAAPQEEKTFVIGPEDDISVTVWGEPQLSGNIRVRPDGMISLPIIDDIKAAGLTNLELKKAITDALVKAGTLRDPLVTVTLIAPHSKKYFLYGNVKSGGEKELIMPTTVLDAIVAAGGFTDFAKTKSIIIARGNQRFTFNFDDVMKGKHLEQNRYLESGDIIWVR